MTQPGRCTRLPARSLWRPLQEVSSATSVDSVS
jgi:hypothetical protein